MKNFKDSYDLTKRKEIYEKQAKMHPTKIAVIVQVHPKSKLGINRYFKFMANSTFTVGSIQQTIKKELTRTSQIPKHDTTTIYLFCQKKILKINDVLKDLLDMRDPDDHFLYLMIAETQAF